MSVLKEYEGRVFVESDFLDVQERIITGIASNRLWLYTVDKVLERDRRTGEWRDNPIVRLVRWKARNDRKNKEKKYWRWGSSYNIRSEGEWTSTSEAVDVLLDSFAEETSYVKLTTKQHTKLISKTDEHKKLKQSIRKIKDSKAAVNTELEAVKKRLGIMRSNARFYRVTLEKFSKKINSSTTTETDIHNFIVDNEMYWIFGLEYVGINSKVKFPPGTNDYEFDLMLLRHDRFQDLVELKGPNESLFDRRTKRRNKPNSKLSEAIGQVFTYLTACERKNMKNVFKPKAFIVIGKQTTDNVKDRRIFTSHLSSVEIMTYTDLYKKGKSLLGYIQKSKV